MPLLKIDDASPDEARATMDSVAYILRVVATTLRHLPAKVDVAKFCYTALVTMASDFERRNPAAVELFERSRQRALQPDAVEQRSKGISVCTDADVAIVRRKGFGRGTH